MLNFPPYITKAVQIGCDLTKLGTGIRDYLATPQGQRKPIEKIVSGVTRVVFTTLEVGARTIDASDKTFSIIKGAEAGGLLVVTLPLEILGAMDDFLNGRISRMRAFEQGIGSLASGVRAALEHAMYTEKYYLSLTDEERAKEFRWVLNLDSDREDPEYEKKPIIKEECERNLKVAEDGIFWTSTAEVSLRIGLISGYQKLTQQLLIRRGLPNINNAQAPVNHVNNAQAPVNHVPNNPDPFDLLRFETIPEELEEDAVFQRFVCPLSFRAVRDPVGDPTICDQNSQIIPSVFERSVLVAWVSEKNISPTTRKPLYLHQLIDKPHLKALIDQRLEFYSNHLRLLAARAAKKVAPPPQNLVQNADLENPGL